ncbi:MAG: glycosyltransferase, partial [Candidatus Helarchaeota archaeon]
MASLRNRVQKIFNRLSKNNLIYVIYFEHEKKGINKSFQLKKNLYLCKPPTFFVKNKLIFYILNGISFFNYINKMIKKYKIDILVSTNFLFSPLLSLSARINKIPFVFDLVDYQPYHIYYMTFLPLLVRKIGIYFLSYLLDYDIFHADYIITTGIPLYKYAKRIKSSKVKIISNGVDLKLFNPAVNGTNIKKKYNLNELTLCFIGALEYWIDYDYLFESLALIRKDYPTAKLVLIGPSIYYGFNKIKNIAKRYNVEKNLIFTKCISYNLLPAYIKACDICLMPFTRNYLTECAIPMKIFEYLACRKPVISVSLAGIKSIFKDAIFYADTPKELKNVIKSILTNSKEYENKINKSKLIIEKYTWDDLSLQFEEVFKSLVLNSN